MSRETGCPYLGQPVLFLAKNKTSKIGGLREQSLCF